ncbi:aldehyde dehydrogenase family protein [Bacillus sp. Marseille-P3661]|uniref:aldehyde dehydrogenase family protein n=1 Tax=Bacillus sp. Marseille-P3661 TaxID=1936234 RepID=UPI000C830A12|nr:aldehyde dehydrogenase family protein [Bacillus sp. Marseille-P3661]
MKQRLLINGEWVESDEYLELKSPYSGDVIAKIPVATEEQTALAIEAAEQAKDKMANMTSLQRSLILENLVERLKARKEEAAQIIAKEAAKPIRTARQEVERTIETYKFAAEEAKRIHGETLPLDAAAAGSGRVAYTSYEPLGVIGAITPFNFPMNLVAHKIGPAIAAGNTIVLKPASQTPLSSIFIAELLQESGLPAGALNIITGKGSVVGEKIVQDPRVKLITFTGSPEVGIGIRNRAGLKRVVLELGSNSALIIDKNVDIDSIIDRCVVGAFSFQGQVCISLQRIYVHEEVYSNFVQKFVEKTNELVIGDPLDDSTDVSALISEGDVKRTVNWIDEAQELGGKLATGGKVEGNILYPTVILNADTKAKVSCQEVFGPIVLINQFKTIEEAFNMVNDSRFGLQAGIYTDNVHTALDAADKLHVGGVMINDIPTFRVDHMPYGGVKESGMGREGIKYSIEEMLEMKLVVWNRNK